MTIPAFTSEGDLPPGIHQATWGELYQRFGINDKRLELLDGLYRALLSLKNAGCQIAYIDGSFVTTKDQPGDFDAAWEEMGVDLDKVDPVLLDFDNLRFAQKQKYGGELFLANESSGQYGGVILDFFQQRRDKGKIGIVKIELSDLNDQE